MMGCRSQTQDAAMSAKLNSATGLAARDEIARRVTAGMVDYVNLG